MKFLSQLKEYWFLIVFIFGGAGTITTIVGNNYVGGVANDTLKSDASKVYLQQLIKDELAASKQFTEVNGTLVLHDSQIKGNAANIVLTQQQLQDVARILMQPPD